MIPVLNKYFTLFFLLFFLNACGDGGNSSPPTNSVSASVVKAIALSQVVSLAWDDIDASSYNVYYSSEANFDPDNYASYTDGTLLTDVSSPLSIPNLTNGTAYYFVVDAVLENEISRSLEVNARPNRLAFNNRVITQAVHANGTKYFSGRFNTVSAISGGGVALEKSTANYAMANFPIVQGSVLASVSDGAGGWYIGGDFTRINDVQQRYLAHILADGTVNPSWRPVLSDDIYPAVRSIIFTENQVYIGGDFNMVNGVSRNNLAALGVDGLLSSWGPNVNGSVSSLVVANNTVYIGGYFSQVEGVARNYLAAIGTDGTLLNWDPNPDARISKIISYNNRIYVSGIFANIGGEPRTGLAALNLDGSIHPWSPVFDGVINDIAIDNNTVYVGGRFTLVDGLARDSIAAISITGSVLDWALSIGVVYKIAASNGIIYIGGRFTAFINGQAVRNIAAVDETGRAVNWNANTNGFVQSISVSQDDVFIGGNFSQLGPGVERRSYAAIDANGVLTDWAPTINKSTSAMVLVGDLIYIGGGFTQVNSVPRLRLAAIDINGVLAPWNPNVGEPFIGAGMINALIVEGSTVYVGGTFTSVAGVARNRVAAFGTDGTLLDWNPDVGIETIGYVSTIKVSANTVYLGGSFSSVGGVPRTNIAAVGVDGMLSDWSPNVDSIVNTFDIDAGIMYLGGYFSNVNGVVRNGLAAVNTSDGALTTWNPDGQGSGVTNLKILNDTVYVGGIIYNISNTRRRGFASIGTNGVLSDLNLIFDDSISDMLISGGNLHLVGGFHTVDGQPHGGFVTIDPNGVIQ